jgi:hypothetical protein
LNGCLWAAHVAVAASSMMNRSFFMIGNYLHDTWSGSQEQWHERL